MLARNFDSLIEKIIRIIVPSIFFLPLLVNANYYFPFITPRNFIFRLLVSLAFALYLIIWARNKEKYKPLVNKSFYFYIILVAILTISSLVNGDFLYSFWGNYERMDGLISWYHLLAFLVVILGVYKSQKSWQYLLRISIFASFLVSFIALSQYFGLSLFLPSSTGARASSMLGNPIYLATYNLFNLFFAAYLWSKKSVNLKKTELWFFYIFDFVLILMELVARLKGNSGPLSQIASNFWLLLFLVVPQVSIHINNFCSAKKARLNNYSRSLYFLFIIIINFFALFNTQTRGVLIGLLMSFFILSIFFIFSKAVSKKIKLSIIFLFIIFIFSIVGIFVFKDSKVIKNRSTISRIANISLTDVTTESRLLTWRLSIKGFLVKPILGYGQENFYVVFNKYFPSEIFKDSGSQIWFDRPHNIFLQYLIDGGILALLSYLAIFFFILKSLYCHYKKTRDFKTIAILGALVSAYLFQNFFVFDSLNSNILFVLLLAVSIFISAREKPKEEKQNKTNGNLLLAMILFVVVVVSAYFINIPQMRANQYLMLELRDIRLNAFKGYDEFAYQNLIADINSNYLGKFEGRQVLSEHVRELILNPNVNYKDKIKPLALAENELLKSIKEQPNNVRQHSFLMSLYSSASLLSPDYVAKNAILAEKAFILSPNRTPLYTSLAQSYFYSGQYDKAIVLFEKAKEISPYNFDSYFDLFTSYVFIKDLDSVRNLLAEFADNFDSIYKFNSGASKDAFDIKQVYAERYYLKFADAYFRLAQTQEAIDLLEKKLLDYPDNPVFIENLIIYYNNFGDSVKVSFYFSNLQKISPDRADQLKDSLGL
ncbi:MAG: O-antigen ligase family protein [bacterium]|nr:O-antigen ligase family protein [bacterium]